MERFVGRKKRPPPPHKVFVVVEWTEFEDDSPRVRSVFYSKQAAYKFAAQEEAKTGLRYMVSGRSVVPCRPWQRRKADIANDQVDAPNGARSAE